MLAVMTPLMMVISTRTMAVVITLVLDYFNHACPCAYTHTLKILLQDLSVCATSSAGLERSSAQYSGPRNFLRVGLAIRRTLPQYCSILRLLATSIGWQKRALTLCRGCSARGSWTYEQPKRTASSRRARRLGRRTWRLQLASASWRRRSLVKVLVGGAPPERGYPRFLVHTVLSFYDSLNARELSAS